MHFVGSNNVHNTKSISNRRKERKKQKRGWEVGGGVKGHKEKGEDWMAWVEAWSFIVTKHVFFTQFDTTICHLFLLFDNDDWISRRERERERGGGGGGGVGSSLRKSDVNQIHFRFVFLLFFF